MRIYRIEVEINKKEIKCYYTGNQRECNTSSTMNLVGIFQGKGRMIP